MTGQQGEREALARRLFVYEQCDQRQALDIEAQWTSRLNDFDQAEYLSLADAALAWFAAQPSRVTPRAEEVRRAVAPVLCNAANYGDAIAPHVLGRDMSPVIDKTTDAVLALFAAQPTVQQVREQVAAEIEADMTVRPLAGHDAIRDAARIARGEKGGE